MMSFIGKRSLASAVSLIGLIVLVFFLSRLTGDPTSLYLPLDASLESREQFREIHGLNDPLLVQFGRYIWDVAALRLRREPAQSAPGARRRARCLPLDAQAGGDHHGPGDRLGHRHRLARRLPKVGGFFDRLSSILSLIGASAPDFWVAIVGILLFSVSLGWLPTSGTGTVWHWILPVAVLFVRPFGLILQVVRGSMITALSSAYVKTARSKGVKDRAVIFVHALRNAMLPVITVIGDQAAGMLNGAVVVETIFGFPGVGKLMIDSILQRDFTVVLASIMVTAIAIFIMNLLIDLAYAALDPRIRM